MQTHQDIWWSVENQIEHAFFRGYRVPHPVLEFTPWPIKVSGIVFSDDSEMTGAGDAQTPWLQNIDGAGYTLNNANLTNITLNGRPLTNVFELKGSVPTQGDLPSNPSIGDVWITQDTGYLYVWDGSQWVDLGPAGSSFQTPWLSDIDAAGFQLFNISNLIDPGDSSNIQMSGDGNIRFVADDYAIFSLSKVGIRVNPPEFELDVNGDINAGNCLYVRAVEFACSNGAGGIDLSNVTNINGTPIAGVGQTPWLSDIDGNGFNLSNVPRIDMYDPSGYPSLNLTGGQPAGGAFSQASITLSAYDRFWTISVYSSNATPGAFGRSPGALTIVGGNPQTYFAFTPSGFGIGMANQAFVGAFPLDVNGVINTSTCYYVASVPFACGNGAGGVNLSNVVNINGSPYTPGGGGAGPTNQGNYGDASGNTDRVIGQDYQNTTGKPMWITVVGQSFADSTAELYIFTDENFNPQTCVAHDEADPVSSGTQFAYACVSAVILPGNWYRVVMGSAGGFTPNWTEWW